MGSIDFFGEQIAIRIFGRTLVDIDDIVKSAVDKEGFLMFESRAHFVRCCVQKVLREGFDRVSKKKKTVYGGFTDRERDRREYFKNRKKKNSGA